MNGNNIKQNCNFGLYALQSCYKTVEYNAILQVLDNVK